MNSLSNGTVKELPNSVEAEQNCLGAIIHSPSFIIDAVSSITSNDFYDVRHKTIFAEIETMMDRGDVIDAFTLEQRLRDKQKLGSVGEAYIGKLTKSVLKPDNWAAYAKIVRDRARLRGAYIAAQEVQSRVMSFNVSDDDDITELLEDLEKGIAKASATFSPKHTFSTLGEIMDASYEFAKEKEKNGDVLNGYSTGIIALDEMTGGIALDTLIIVAGRPGMGKCLGKDTPVLMFDGRIKPVQDVRNGEYVMGPNGAKRLVSGVTSGTGQLYRVTPNKGDSYVVNEDHVLSLRMSADKSEKFNKGDIVNVSVKDYLDLPVRIKHSLKGWRSGIDFPDQFVGLDPYFLGLWLGDGNSANTGVTSMDPEVVTYLQGFCDGYGLCMSSVKAGGKSRTYSIRRKRADVKAQRNDLLWWMKHYMLINNKFIPYTYRINSREVRLQLLAGIIDSDGSLCGWNGKGTCYEVSTVSDQLAKDYLWLARSLGFAAYDNPGEKSIKSIGFTGTYHRITITGRIQDIPCKLPRKKTLGSTGKKDVTSVGITVEPIGEGEYFGFCVDQDHLFMLGDFTVTHNTTLVEDILINVADYPEPCRAAPTLLFSGEMSLKQVGDKALSRQGSVRGRNIKRATLSNEEWESLKTAVEESYAIPHYVEPAVGMTLSEVRAIIRRAVREKGVKVVAIDYLQLLRIKKEGQSGNRPQEIGEIARSLKELALELHICIIALSQLSRAVESREGKRPQMSDLKESGDIEAAADVVILIYRDQYYEGQKEVKYQGLADPGKEILKEKAEIIIGKNREFETGTVMVTFYSELSHFADYDDYQEDAEVDLPDDFEPPTAKVTTVSQDGDLFDDFSGIPDDLSGLTEVQDAEFKDAA